MNELKNNELSPIVEKTDSATGAKSQSRANNAIVKYLFSKLVIAALLVIPFHQVYAANDKLFPRPAEIEPDIKFWTRVFTEITTKQGFIHDDRYLGVVYEKVDLPQHVSRRRKQKYIERRKKHYAHILRHLARSRTHLSREEKRILDLWPDNVSNATLRSATNRLRFQLGQADKYLAGLKRSGAWKPYIIKTLDKMGLPREIASLPHVESSFNPYAYSKVGAAGLWQFTRSTGRRFMRIDYIVDERMDPFKATVAAARLLENNYAVTGTWPLALTAYNHGAAGMRNAARVIGTTNIATILRKYRSRSFKFASRNFYVAFLAAVDVEKNAKKYFGDVKLDPPIEDNIVKVPAYISIRNIHKALGVSMAELKIKNPALRPSVWRGQKLVPRGYELRIGKNDAPKNAEQILAQLPASTLYARQTPDIYHRVRRGQTLSSIARRYHVSIRQLMALNNLRSSRYIYVGQRLRLPQRGGSRIAASHRHKRKVVSLSSLEGGTYIVRRGDSIHKISKRFGISKREILALNDIHRVNRIYPGQVLRLKTSEKPDDDNSDMIDMKGVKGGTTYTVRRGDSILEISKRFGISKGEILALNDIHRANRIYPGQVLRLKAGEKPADNSSDMSSEDDTTDTSGSESQIATENAVSEEKQAMADDQDNTPQDTTSVADNTSDDGVEEPADSGTSMPKLPPAANILLPSSPDAQVAKVEKPNLTDSGLTVTQSSANTEDDSQDTNLDSGLTSEEEDQNTQDDLDLAADPSDYSVAKNHTIEVQAAETLGHYAEWLDLRASQLRRVNRMRYGKPVVIGKRIKLIFTRVTPEKFEKQRKEYHRMLQEQFFNQFEIAGSEKHTIRRGESIWRLTKRKYNIPIWLLRQYNPDLSISDVKPGTKVTFPRIEERPDISDDSSENDNGENDTEAAKSSTDLVANK